MNEYMEMIREGNGWYAMQVGLIVVFTSLLLVSTVITLTGLFFRKREVWKKHRSGGANGFAAVADAIATDSGDDSHPVASGELELVAAAVTVALALHGTASTTPSRVDSHDGGSDSWKLAGRMQSHDRVRRSR